MSQPPVQDSAALRLLLSTVLDAAVAIDAEGKVVGWNRAAEQTFGWSRAEALGQNLNDLIVPSRHQQAHAHGMHRYQQTGVAHVVNRRIEIEARAKSGREFPIELSITEAHDGSGAAFVGFMRDISERIAMERRLRESQKLEAVGHLTGGIAHDFNNLLTVILGNAEILAESITDPELKPLAEVTLSAAERGAELTNRLLAFARRQPLDPKPTNVNQLVGAMQGIVRRTLPESIDVEFHSDPDLGLIEIDAGELDSALLNLVVNARDAMEDEGKLVIETANTRLGPDYALRYPEVVPGEYIMLCVTDTGTGMDAVTAGRAFEPFFTTKPVGKGSGLGLSMVFGFTKQSGGHIEICSEPGVGTKIKLYFPRLPIGQPAKADLPSEVQPQGGTERILIVEDNALVLSHLQRQLVLLGYRVKTAMSGREAMVLLQADDEVDLLLTDIVMPGGMNGTELADWARTFRPSLRVLFTSGYTDNAIDRHGRLDPGVDLLRKPYTRLELSKKVREVLQREI